MMQLLQCLFFIEAYFQFHLSGAYLPGVANGLVDDLSWDRFTAFLAKITEAAQGPSCIPLCSTAVAMPQPRLDIHMDGS